MNVYNMYIFKFLLIMTANGYLFSDKKTDNNI